MTISAAQIREARRLLRRSSSWLSEASGVRISVVLKAQLDAEIVAQLDDEIGSVDFVAIDAIEKALTGAGALFTANSVRLRGMAKPELRQQDNSEEG